MLYVNDSKATNVASTLTALEAFAEAPLHLILGGQGKGQDFAPLRAAAARCAGVYLIGEDGRSIADGEWCETLEGAVGRARRNARPGDVVLLSPACASFDQFEDFEARGRRVQGAGRLTSKWRFLMANRAAAARAPKAKPLEHNILLTATLCLLAIGAVMVYSASSGRPCCRAAAATERRTSSSYLMYGAIGLVPCTCLRAAASSRVRATTPLLAISFFLLLAVKVPGIGVEVNGARRWIGAGPLQFQPSELLKLALRALRRALLAEKPKRVNDPRLLMPLLGVVGGACLLVGSQPDLGTAMVDRRRRRHALLVGGRHPVAPPGDRAAPASRSWSCCSRCSSRIGARA